MTISFSKHPSDKVKYPEYWYLDHPTWRGSIEDLRLPTSFNSLIDKESGIVSKHMVFEISEASLPESKNLVRLMHEEMDGGRYDSIHGEVFICDMLLLYFRGGYPYKIYYKVKDE